MKKLTTILIVLLLVISNAAYPKNQKEDTDDNKIKYLNIEWWDKFDDSMLHDYMITLFKNNHDLKIAKLKIKEGEQLVRQSLANESNKCKL